MDEVADRAYLLDHVRSQTGHRSMADEQRRAVELAALAAFSDFLTAQFAAADAALSERDRVRAWFRAVGLAIQRAAEVRSTTSDEKGGGGIETGVPTGEEHMQSDMQSDLVPYEIDRARNIASNAQMLRQLGLS